MTEYNGAERSITTELREWLENAYTYGTGDDLFKKNYRPWFGWKLVLEPMLDAIEAELAERYVALPLDADGVPIHIGDSIEIIGGEYGTAVAIEQCEDGGWNVSMRPAGWDTPTLFSAESVRHHHPPTVEDILDKFATDYDQIAGGDEDHQKYLNLIAEYAKRLRLAGEDE